MSVLVTNVQARYYDDQEIQSALVSQMKGREGAFLVEVDEKDQQGRNKEICKRSLDIPDDSMRARQFLMKAMKSFESSCKAVSPVSVLSTVELFRNIKKLDQLGTSLRTGWDYVMDIDAEPFDGSLEGPKQCTLAIAHLFANLGFTSFKIKFSGMKGFHIIIHSEAFKDTVLTREKFIRSYPAVPKILSAYIQSSLPKKALIGAKIEYANFYNPRRLLRLAYGLHNTSRLASVPLHVEDIKNFEPADARPENIRSLDWNWLNFRSGSDNADDLLRAAFEWKTYVERAIKKREKAKSLKGIRHTIRPCVTSALSNRELPHMMRLCVAVEYLQSGYSEDDIVQLFKNQLDFSASTTRYQIKHAKQQGYAFFTCRKIHEIGFCVGQMCSHYRKYLES